MNEPGLAFREGYRAALRVHLAGTSESSLQKAYELGRRAVAEGIGLLDLAALHHEALLSALATDGRRESEAALRGASEFLSESLGPFEMVYRGFREANTELARVNAELAEQTRRAEEASLHKSQFLANMSHELRTPLNAILGFADLLAEQLGTVLSDRQRRYLRHIHDAGDHLLALINDVLDLSKVEAGRLEIRPEAVTLDELLAPVVVSTRAAAEARVQRFEVTAAPDVSARVDPARIRQVLYNLLSNAVKFTPEGGRVDLRVTVDGRDVGFEVADTGIGIPPHKHDRVFGVFERLHEGHSGASGTGLGLALTKRIVELHRGTIEFESTQGLGTTFRVRLPDVAVEEVRGERVLVVEDDARDGELIAELASEAGLRAEIATTFAQARRALQREGIRGVAVDLRLPDARGEQLLAVLKADPATRDIPVIVVTVEDDVARSLALGADDHLTKPLDRARLAAWMRRAAALPATGPLA